MSLIRLILFGLISLVYCNCINKDDSNFLSPDKIEKHEDTDNDFVLSMKDKVREELGHDAEEADEEEEVEDVSEIDALSTKHFDD